MARYPLAAGVALIAIVASSRLAIVDAVARVEGLAAWPISPESLRTPAAANSAQPQRSVSERGVLLSWIERAGDLATLRFAERTASGWTDATKGGALQVRTATAAVPAAGATAR